MPSITIEEKHTYQNQNNFIVGNNRTTNVTAPVNNFVWFTPYYPVLGTDENNRIGRKIHTSYIGVEGYLLFNTRPANANSNYPALSDYFNGYMQQFIADTPPESYEYPTTWQNLVVPIRHMVVEFDDEDFYDGTQADKGTYLSNWYKSLVTQIAPTSYYPPNQQSTLRESTPYTGRYRILKDTTYWLDFKDKHSIHYNYTLPYKKNVNFEADGSDPTNTHIYFLFIGPTQPLTDYGNLGFGDWLNTPANDTAVPPVVATIHNTLKLKYTDF